jgi:uncharacterized protein (TIGR03790 family)
MRLSGLGMALVLLAAAGLHPSPTRAQAGAAPVLQAQPAPAPHLQPAPPPPVPVPRLSGRLGAADIGLIVNTADPYSVAVGAHYRRARGLTGAQVLEVELPLRPTLTPEEFESLRQRVRDHFGAATQALALAWTAPYAVACNSLTGALALGLDLALCSNSCGPSQLSPYFNSASIRPWQEHGLRPAMLLAAADVDAARALIDRGVAADGSLALRGRPPVHAALLSTTDRARAVRERLYPPPGLLRGPNVRIQVLPAVELGEVPRVLMVTTGSVQAPVQPPPQWVAGGLGDHLTSFGGALQGAHGQGTALDWLASGATASHGTVSEPCNHLQKFPHPQVLLGHYLQGATALEAYWKSVAWPQQSLFVGEPLAAPFAPPFAAAAPRQR